MRSKSEQYAHLKKEAKCVLECGRAALPGRVRCDDCTIKAVWRAAENAADRLGHEPLSVTQDEFVAWYKARREACDGECEWCGESFGKNGPCANHDRFTGDLRALLCETCNKLATIGLDRLEKVVSALESWNSGKTTRTPSTGMKTTALEHSFPRWAKFVETSTKNRDQRMHKVVAEMRKHCRSDEDLLSCYDSFRSFLEKYEVTSGGNKE